MTTPGPKLTMASSQAVKGFAWQAWQNLCFQGSFQIEDKHQGTFASGKRANIKRFIGRLAFGFEPRPMYSEQAFCFGLFKWLSLLEISEDHDTLWPGRYWSHVPWIWALRANSELWYSFSDLAMLSKLVFHSLCLAMYVSFLSCFSWPLQGLLVHFMFSWSIPWISTRCKTAAICLSFISFFLTFLCVRTPGPATYSALMISRYLIAPASTLAAAQVNLLWVWQQSAKLAHTSKCMQIQANALFHSEEWSGSSPFSCLVQSCTEIWGLSYVICIIVMLMSMQWARWHVLRRFNYASVIFVHWTSHCSHLFTTTPWPKTCVVNRDDTKGDSDSHCSPPRGTGMSR